MKVKDKLEKIKQYSVNLTSKTLSVLAYFLGVSLSFFLWKLSTFLKKENKSYWSEIEEKEEDYKSQY